MRRVVLQMGVTLDGYVAGPGGEGHWGLPPEHPDVRAWKVASRQKLHRLRSSRADTSP